ncbi:hypothetical protein T484DRAFT_1756489 [Baffinella frigidus]|nr:hypothetical protein T484DRAFT_1756489 [Cryptophyta sp. CCMP2293]
MHSALFVSLLFLTAAVSDVVAREPCSCVCHGPADQCSCVNPELLTADGCFVLCPRNYYCLEPKTSTRYNPRWNDVDYPQGTRPNDQVTYMKKCPFPSVSKPGSFSVRHCECPVNPPPSRMPHLHA